MNARDALIEEVAATIAVAKLVGRHKTWGDLIERQKETYRGLAREVVGVVDRAKTPHADLAADGWHMTDASKREVPSPLWCANDTPHDPHGARDEFGGWNHCTGRPVFEKAYAPTDDERKAMLESIQAGMAYYAREDIPEDGLTEAEQIVDFLTDAGFRRVEESS